MDTLEPTAQKMTLLSPVDDAVVVDDVQLASKADVDRAVSAAKNAFRYGAWAKYTGIQRAACLNKFADLVEKHAERLAYAEALPSGRPIAGVLYFDLPHMVEVYRCMRVAQSVHTREHVSGSQLLSGY